MGYYVKVEPDVKIYVEDLNEEGEKTIVFLHGWPGSHKLFEYQFNVLPKMGFRCIGIDQRGFGDSDKPFNGYDYDRLSDDVRKVIEVLNLDEFTLVGHSTGGAIAVRYMARHKEHGVSKLVLCAAAAPSLIQRPNFPYGLPKESVIDIIKGTYSDRPKMLKGFGDIFFYKHISEAFSEWFFQLGLQAAGWSTAETANTWLGEEMLFSDLEKITVPTLILHGIHDQVCLFQLAEAQKQRISNSKLIPFNESGHGLFYDEKEKFNKVLAQFVNL
ncbi:alpha/beta fold hydrolase [Clostridium chromiireducens]|uniref:Alpha/beta fold hydrolase n=1 Tax=Clostridium chromiireducens TaxID=225345 RepID=A0A964RLV0_9CLOT|nr:alpha/beta hydrolase [Clostridium chromiireducens]MVX64078.1 alpha/beta fold hydrolase [Clostridium chromiireducens]